MTSTYDRPVRELIQDALAEMPETFRARDMVQWFAKRYDKIKPETVRAHLRRACVNIRQDLSGSYWDPSDRTVYRLGHGQFTRYRPEVHDPSGEGLPLGLADEVSAADPNDGTDGGAAAAFALELHLEEFMEANWTSIMRESG